MTEAQFMQVFGSDAASQTAGAGASQNQASSTPASAPIISINGNNPAHIHVGATYNDLGATITGPADADKNLGGHTLGPVVAATEKLTGCAIEPGYLDRGYRGHNAAKPRRFFLSGQRRGVFGVIKRELRRRSAIEAVIGPMKNEGHLGRCWLKGRAGDAANVILSAVGYNLRLVLAWLRVFLRLILNALIQALRPPSALKSAC